MKKALSILLILSMLMTCITAFASVETEDRLVSLSNKTIKSVLNKNGYKGWKLYQPSSRETGINTSSGSFLKTIDLYAVVATKDDEIHLIVLQKRNNKWEINTVSNKAITRNGFRLFCFSMDENVSSEDETLYFYFDFADAEDKVYTLRLDMSLRFPTYFRFLGLPGEDTDNGHIYHEIIMDYDRNFTFELDVFGGGYREYISVEPWHQYHFGVNEFSLAEMPLSILDLTKPATVKAGSGQVGLYRYPMDSGKPVRFLNEGDSVKIVRLEYGSDNWMIVCVEDEVYFAPGVSFEY